MVAKPKIFATWPITATFANLWFSNSPPPRWDQHKTIGGRGCYFLPWPVFPFSVFIEPSPIFSLHVIAWNKNCIFQTLLMLDVAMWLNPSQRDAIWIALCNFEKESLYTSLSSFLKSRMQAWRLKLDLDHNVTLRMEATRGKATRWKEPDPCQCRTEVSSSLSNSARLFSASEMLSPFILPNKMVCITGSLTWDFLHRRWTWS